MRSTPPEGPPGGLFGDAAVDAAAGDRAWVAAMLDVEAALAAAGAAAGVVPEAAARAIAEACASLELDPGELGRRGLATGGPVVPLVESLRAAVVPSAAAHVHRGATSQDVLDTAASLVARRALDVVLDDLAAVAGACATFARAHRDTLMPGRTLLRQAAPTTFGLKCAGWLVAVDEARSLLARVREERLAAQLGGAVGTLAALGDAGLDVAAAFASHLGLPEPALPWHTHRMRVAELAGALGATAGVLGKIGLDVVLLAQSEVAEVSAGSGGSSTLPLKRNPVRAVLAVACARRAPGLVATLLGDMLQEHERAAGGWQAEWEPLRDLLRVTGAAAEHVRVLLGELRVDAAAMRAHVVEAGDLLTAEAVSVRLTPHLGATQAADLVRASAASAVASGRRLGEVLAAEPLVVAHLSAAELADALDPARYLGSAGALVDRALAAHSDLERAR